MRRNPRCRILSLSACPKPAHKSPSLGDAFADAEREAEDADLAYRRILSGFAEDIRLGDDTIEAFEDVMDARARYLKSKAALAAARRSPR